MIRDIWREERPKREVIKKKRVTTNKLKPGQAYSVRKLYQLQRQGINLNVVKRAFYEMDTFGEDVNPVRNIKDLTDIDTLKQNIDVSMKAIDKIKKAKETKEKEAKKAKEKADIIAEYEKSKEQKE